DDGDDGDWAEESDEADAAGLEGDSFAVGGELAETDEQADQKGHRDGDAEGLRDEVGEDAQDHPSLDALLEEVFGDVHEGRNLKDEGEDDERQEEGRDGFPDDVTVDDAQHASSHDSTDGGDVGRPTRTFSADFFASDLPD